MLRSSLTEVRMRFFPLWLFDLPPASNSHFQHGRVPKWQETDPLRGLPLSVMLALRALVRNFRASFNTLIAHPSPLTGRAPQDVRTHARDDCIPRRAPHARQVPRAVHVLPHDGPRLFRLDRAG
jgi:hypothetical protein